MARFPLYDRPSQRQMEEGIAELTGAAPSLAERLEHAGPGEGADIIRDNLRRQANARNVRRVLTMHKNPDDDLKRFHELQAKRHTEGTREIWRKASEERARQRRST